MERNCKWFANDPINVVREDPFVKDYYIAGSERAVYVSFDDGANWQSLRLNMPATSIRDLLLKMMILLSELMEEVLDIG
jgi:hypothetical protein